MKQYLQKTTSKIFVLVAALLFSHSSFAFIAYSNKYVYYTGETAILKVDYCLCIPAEPPIGSANIDLYKGGVYQSSIASNVSIPYNWTVPALAGGTYRIRITKVSTGEYHEMDFQINPLSPNALQFSGSNQCVVTPASSKLTFGSTSNFTAEAVVKLDQVIRTGSDPIYEMIFYNTFDDEDHPNDYLQLYLNRSTTTNGNDIIIFNSGNTTASFSKNLRDGKCHHIAFVRDGNLAKFYLDGVLQSSQTQSASSGSTGNPALGWGIGAAPRSNNLFDYVFRGMIKEGRIWNIARSQTQIDTYKSLGLMGSESNLVAYWPMNEGTGQFVYDKTSSPVNGYLGLSSSTTTADPTWITNSCTTANSRLEENEEGHVASSNLESLEMSVFPNPFTEEINVSLPGNEVFKVDVLNNLGTVVNSTSSAVHSYTFGRDLPRGHYYVKISGNGVEKVLTVIKK